MSDESNMALVRQFLTRFKAGQYERLHELQARVDWDIFPGAAEPYVPWMGHFEGREGADACTEAFDGTLTTNQFDITKLFADSGEVAAFIRAIWVNRASGRPFNLDFFAVFTVENEKIVSVREFGDTAAAIDAYRQTPLSGKLEG
tara:strand:+ start:114 stop:548 length:435 start_codon:yes stop_codon:yes gene_type:complete